MPITHRQFSWQNAASQILPVVAHTASFTLQASDFGKIHTTRGATGAIVFTVPAAATSKGGFAIFINVADQDMTVAGANTDELVVFNDAAADSIGFTTTGEQIGGMFLAICDGTGWCVAPIATETQTVTIAT